MSDNSPRRRLLIGLGVALALVGVVLSVVLLTVATQRRDNAVEGLARAPVGCDTTLEFAETGEYTLYLERTGRIDAIRGSCDVDGDFTTPADPDVEIVVLDSDGDEVDLVRAGRGPKYSAAGFEGEPIFVVDIDDTDEHVIRVESDDDETFAVAVGRNPNGGVSALRIGAATSALVGLLGGAALILAGARRKKVPAPVAGAWHASAPSTPIYYGQPGQAPQGPPVYGQPGQSAPPTYPPQQYPPHQQQYPQQQHYPPQQPQYPPQQQPQYPQQQYAPSNPYGQPPSPPPPPAPPAHATSFDHGGRSQPIDWSPTGATPSEVAGGDAETLERDLDDRHRPPTPPS